MAKDKEKDNCSLPSDYLADWKTKREKYGERKRERIFRNSTHEKWE